MTRYERVKNLCKQYGYTITGTERTLGFAKGSLCKIDKSMPNSDRLMALASYLHTTPEYIMYGDDIPDTHKNDDLLDMEKLINEIILKLSESKTATWGGKPMCVEDKDTLLNSLVKDMMYYTAQSKK